MKTIYQFLPEDPVSLIAIGLSILIVVWLLYIQRVKNQRKKYKPIDYDLYDQLFIALGSKNIKKFTLVQKRIQVELLDINQVNQQLIESLEIPVFVTGDKITLLIKEYSESVFQYLNEKRKEGK